MAEEDSWDNQGAWKSLGMGDGLSSCWDSRASWCQSKEELEPSEAGLPGWAGGKALRGWGVTQAALCSQPSPVAWPGCRRFCSELTFLALINPFQPPGSADSAEPLFSSVNFVSFQGLDRRPLSPPHLILLAKSLFVRAIMKLQVAW